MADKSFEDGLKKWYGDRFANVSHSSTEEVIKNVYDDFASKFEEETRGVYRKPLAQCLDTAIQEVFPDKPKDEIRIIDAGAGTGLTGVEVSKLGYTNLHALDISQEMLNEAKKKNLYKKLICAPLNDQQIPEIETGEFHALICTGTLVKGHARPTALVEMLRMVRPDGIICFNLRGNELDDYQGMMSKLEKAGRWSLFSKTTVPYFAAKGLPKETSAFVYRVLKVLKKIGK